jgi:hypothetical protein
MVGEIEVTKVTIKISDVLTIEVTPKQARDLRDALNDLIDGHHVTVYPVYPIVVPQYPSPFTPYITYCDSTASISLTSGSG